MFIKTFKYDFLSIFDKMKYYLIVYLGSELLLKILSLFEYNFVIIDIITGIAAGAYVCCIAASLIIPLALCMKRYLKTMLSDEGYLIHCLPVKKSTLLLSKYLNVFVYYIIISLITILSIVLMSDGQLIKEFGEMLSFIGPEIASLDDFWIYFILILLNALSYSILFISCCSMVLSIGYSFDKNKSLKSFLFGMLVYVVYQTIASSISVTGLVNMGNEVSLIPQLIVNLVINLIGIVVSYLINYYMINKHLNLE